MLIGGTDMVFYGLLDGLRTGEGADERAFRNEVLPAGFTLGPLRESGDMSGDQWCEMESVTLRSGADQEVAER